MNDAPVVEIVGGKGPRKQWGMNFLYHKQGKKNVLNSKAVIILAIAFLLIALIASVAIETQPTRSEEKSEIKLRDEFGGEKIIEVPTKIGAESRSEAESHTPNKSKATLTQSVAQSPGVQLIARETILHIPPGSLTKAKLITGASNGLVRAQVSEALRINGETLIPSGATLLGTGSSTVDRLYVNFRQLVFKDGNSSQIEAQACDGSDQIPGLKGTLIGFRALKLGAAVGLNFASGLSQGLQETSVQSGVAVKPPSTRNALLNGASHAALDQSRDMMSDLKNKTPIIEVAKDTDILVIYGSGG